MQYWGLTDPGCVRAQNQDAYQIVPLDHNTLLCVLCDGMGGAKSGNIASSLATDVFVQEVSRVHKPGLGQAEVDQMMTGGVKLANFTVHDQGRQFEEFAGMGTTLVAAYISAGKATIINVGDSRCYVVRRGGIHQVTRDHSLVAMMVESGELPPELARDFPGKNYITRAIGTESMVEGDLFHLNLEQGDGLLLCSDGLSNMMDEQEILFEVVHGVNKQQCCQRLLDIAKMRGAPDNVTSVLAIV